MPAADRALLDGAERARAGAMSGPSADRFVLGRVLLRHALAARLGCHPGDVILSARCSRCGGPHGPVRVTTPGRRLGDASPESLHASVTRRGPLVAVAVCDGAQVGIDVEAPAAVAAAPLADVALSRDERVRHRGWSRRARIRSLTRTWVRKEAALKALRLGLNVDPASVELRSPLTGVHGVDAVVGDSVAVADLRLGRGAIGAVAVVVPDLVGAATVGAAGSSPRLVVHRYDGVSTLGGQTT